jgi:hypothetical protein
VFSSFLGVRVCDWVRQREEGEGLGHAGERRGGGERKEKMERERGRVTCVNREGRKKRKKEKRGREWVTCQCVSG